MPETQQVGLSVKISGDIPTGKVTANSTAPTTLVAAGYVAIRTGHTVRLALFAEWTNAGATNTTATFTLDDVLAALEAKGIVPVVQNTLVAGQSIANDSAIGTALLNASTGAAVATFGSASLTKIEQVFTFETN